MIGALIGAGLSAVGGIMGNISASRAMKKAKRNIEAQKEENQTWYDRRYNEDATQRADAQRLLTMLNENIRDRNRQASGTQAVMGGTEESVAAAKAANNEAVAKATSQIAADAERRKDNIENQYRANKDSLQGQLNDMEVGRAQSTKQASAAVSKIGADIAGAIDGLSDNNIITNTGSEKVYSINTMGHVGPQFGYNIGENIGSLV